MNYTDTQLKQALAKMLPKKIMLGGTNTIRWIDPGWNDENPAVSNTELLHLCWLVEKTMPNLIFYCKNLTDLCGNLTANIHATWQQRVIALCKVKGIEI